MRNLFNKVNSKFPAYIREQAVYILGVIGLLVLLSTLSGCTNKPGAIQALEDSGYKRPYVVGGYGLLSCSEDDIYRTRFTAYSPDSTRKVSGCVCQGLLKGKTVRLD